MLNKALVFSLAVFAACASAQAVTVLDNISNLGNPGGVQPGFTSGTTIGESFVTGSTALSMAYVIFPQINGTSNAFTSTETFSLFSNNPATNLPLASIANFNLISDSTLAYGTPGFGQTEADPSATMLLSPLTRYWLVLNDSVANSWDYLPSSTYAAALGATIPTTNASYKIAGGITTTYNLSAGPQQFYLVANAVPEPSSLALLTLAGAGAVLVARRTRSAKVV